MSCRIVPCAPIHRRHRYARCAPTRCPPLSRAPALTTAHPACTAHQPKCPIQHYCKSAPSGPHLHRETRPHLHRETRPLRTSCGTAAPAACRTPVALLRAAILCVAFCVLCPMRTECSSSVRWPLVTKSRPCVGAAPVRCGACCASSLPNALRVVTRSTISPSARSAMPIARMQWWILPGPSRPCNERHSCGTVANGTRVGLEKDSSAGAIEYTVHGPFRVHSGSFRDHSGSFTAQPGSIQGHLR